MADAATILIVDDQEPNRQVLNDLVLTLGHKPVTAENGLSALARIRRQPPDVILLDIMMPEMDGYQVLEALKRDSALRHLPVIVISAQDEMDSVVRCIELGADDYLVKPFNPTLLKSRLVACLERKHLRDQEERQRALLEDYSLRLEERVREQVRKITSSHLATIFAVSKLVGSRDHETGRHLERLRETCRLLIRQLATTAKYASLIDDAMVDNLYASSPLHDIGKVAIPDNILKSPGKFTDEEYEIMKTHTVIGAETLKEVDRQYPGNDFVRMGIQVAESHHEKWDGTGYPHRLVGEDIPLVGRIVALADVYDAMRSKRCYKDALTHEQTREYIVDQRGQHFDPDVVDAFLAVESEFRSVRMESDDS